jgi:hypothetical protein
MSMLDEDMQSAIMELSIDELSDDEDVGQAIEDDDMSDADELVSVCWANPGTVPAAMPPVRRRAAAMRSSFFISTSAECGFARWGKLRAGASAESQALTNGHTKMMERSRPG